ncbi:MAG: hypothetical protein JO313_12990 [Verrucomicrobia bacterium]|nr:hypothetical protein [Verrucomicrobiota bacterium]MBV9130015.1 hypothetical protein [Verrucomicrobiota bacterium]MBV9643638.1 hypothetical protein [Verrucomicrobiota bacterium]
MNQEASKEWHTEKWAYGIMGGFLSLTFLVAWTVWIDSQHRVNLEKITEPTAVGDPVMLSLDPRDNLGRGVLNLKGQPYFLQTNEPVNLPEFDALKIGKDDNRKIQLYQARKQNDLRVVLVKIGPNKFLRLTPRP